jgi:hypothetical protein
VGKGLGLLEPRPFLKEKPGGTGPAPSTGQRTQLAEARRELTEQTSGALARRRLGARAAGPRAR